MAVTNSSTTKNYLLVWASVGLAITGLLPAAAFAYVGPGAGLTAIGTILALVAAFFLAIVGFVWYPVKRLLRRGKSHGPEAGAATVERTDQTPEKE